MVGIRKQKIGRRLGKQTGVGMGVAVSKWPEIGLVGCAMGRVLWGTTKGR
jgi:hypothetical protein